MKVCEAAKPAFCPVGGLVPLVPRSNNPLNEQQPPEVTVWLFPTQSHSTVSPTLMVTEAGLKISALFGPTCTCTVLACAETAKPSIKTHRPIHRRLNRFAPACLM